MFDLTRQERQAILFLFALALFGAGINVALKINSHSRILPELSLDFSRIDLNRAGKEALMEAPGIGEKLAGRILEYRSKQGGFSDIEELKNIPGINANRYEKLKGCFAVK